MNLRPYLFFNGRAREAIAFYEAALGAEVQMLLRFKDAPEGPRMPPPEMADMVMHATLKVGAGTLFLSDGMSDGTPKFDGFSLSLDVPDEAGVDRLCTALANGGTVTHPPAATFFAKRFAMATDKFGIGWMIMCEA